MIRIWIRRLVILLLVIGVALAAWLAFRAKPVLVDIATIERGPMEVSIEEEGIARVRNVYTLSSPIAGHLQRIQLDEGDRVEANKTVVASIRPLEPPFLDLRARNEAAAAVEAARSAVKLAQAELESAETALSLSMSEFERMRKLAGQNFVSESQLERAQSDVRLKQAQVASAQANIRLRQAELASAEARLEQPGQARRVPTEADCCVAITAPVDGVVLKVLIRSEQAVTAGMKIAEIGDPRDIEIAVDLLSKDAVRLRPGGKAIITDWGGGTTFTATIRRIDPAAFTKVSALGIEEQRVNAVLDPDETPEGLGHDYRIYAQLVVWSGEDVLTVPIASLFRAGGDWAVFVVEDGKARQRKIEVDHMNASDAQVTAGLEAGETVILYPSDLISDGSPVEVRSNGE